jgi:hypothetical protein
MIEKDSVFLIETLNFDFLLIYQITYFELTTKKYRKLHSKIQIDWIKFYV